MGSRYTRLFTSYSYQQVSYSEGSEDLRARFSCVSCTRSTLGASLLRDTRVGLPFATGGSLTSISGEFNGGLLGGTGDYRKLGLEGRWYAPLGTLGGGGQLGAGVQFVLGITAKSGFIFGDAGPFFTEMFSLGGVQYGIPLRGYEEFSITPDGFDPGGERQPGEPGRLRRVVRRLHGRGGRADQPVDLPEHVLRRGQRLSVGAAVEPDAALPRRGFRRGGDLAARADRRGPGLRIRPGGRAGPVPIPAGSCTSSWAISSSSRTHLSSGAEHEACRRGRLGGLDRGRAVRARNGRRTGQGRGRQDRVREHPGHPQRDSGVRRGRVDLRQGARDLPGRGAEAAGDAGLRRPPTSSSSPSC